jgi:hypothetical protein
MSEENTPKPGDRVLLTGSHKWAGYEGLYLRDGEYMTFGKRPVVRLIDISTLTFVLEPETQMRKVQK